VLRVVETLHEALLSLLCNPEPAIKQLAAFSQRGQLLEKRIR
jgi:hypothetical protein